MSIKSLSKVRRYVFNGFLFLWVAGLHVAVVFAFEGTAHSPNQSVGSAIQVNIGLHVNSLTTTPKNEREIDSAMAPTPTPEPEPQPEPQPEPEPVAAVTPELRLQQRTPPTKPTSKTSIGSTRENALAALNSSSLEASQASPGSPGSIESIESTESTKTASPTPIKVSRLEYVAAPPRPAYPSHALKKREQGLVVVRVVIDRSGNVSDAAVWQSSGSDALDRSALLAVQTTRFKPYQENGVAREATADIPFNFILKR